MESMNDIRAWLDGATKMQLKMALADVANWTVYPTRAETGTRHFRANDYLSKIDVLDSRDTRNVRKFLSLCAVQDPEAAGKWVTGGLK